MVVGNCVKTLRLEILVILGVIKSGRYSVGNRIELESKQEEKQFMHDCLHRRRFGGRVSDHP